MARVLLVMPQLPQRLGAPYLGQLYLAASLDQAGHTTRAIDLGARFAAAGDEAVHEAVEAFSPDAVAMTLFTYNASAAYRLAGQLSGKVNLLVAGGPHVTVRPEEPLAHGFDLSIAGEGEISLPLALEALDAGGDATKVPGARGPAGAGPPTEPIARLEHLPAPHLGLRAFELAGYWPPGTEEPPIPGGMMTSRGCPARCTFCANYVTGRVFRWRPAQDVVGEMVALRRCHGVTTFPFWDDAFTAHRPRLDSLCDAIMAEPALSGTSWTCITPANMVKPRDLKRMREAGCVAINFGIESADAAVLRTIEKGQRPDQVRAAVMAARAEGMSTVVNFMFGFPGEGVAELEATRSFMEELAPHTDYFNSRGVLVPFPGTPVYERHHEGYGFTDWWLDATRIPAELDEPDPVRALAQLEHDPALDVDYFRYTHAARDAIADCVRFKARHNQATVARLAGVDVDTWRARLAQSVAA
ncbi:MAG: radical SAM protein [Myxococcota bacterium]|nr:radical SAM protein [Myxococcota bacterium]